MESRKQLLEAGLTEEKNVTTLVASTLLKDAKFLKKAKRDLEDQIEDAEDNLQERLSSNTALDKSVVEVAFSGLKELKEKLELYQSFENQFFPKEQSGN